MCGHWNDAVRREWLVTNGLGGYACGTITGANTRRYHGFLMASLKPPVERTLLVAKLDVSVEYLGQVYHLSANEFVGGTVDPTGFIHLESFDVQDGVPIWRYAIADAILEQKIFMARGANTSYLRLEVSRASAPLRIELKPLVTYRDYHSQGRGARPFKAVAGADHCTVEAFEGARPYRLAISRGTHTAADIWYWNFLHREEFGRGLDALEDLWGPGLFTAEISPGQSLFFSATAEAATPAPGDEVLAAVVGDSRRLVAALPKSAPSWIQTLATASDQFIVQRGATETARPQAEPAAMAGTGASTQPAKWTKTTAASTTAAVKPTASKPAASASIIAGYPWFTDWGRDTMIALPGLATALGRFDTAAAILRTYAGFVDRGMLPNRFSDAGETVEYNTADATLWMFHAASEQLEAKRDPDLQRDLFPTLAGIIHAHVDGTRYGIQVDPTDGLLRAGEAGTQLTWMDAKHGDRVFTPRTGKPVEINALWLNALEVTVRLAGRVRNTAEKRFCQDLLKRAGENYQRFWNEAKSCLYDVIDVDGGTSHDATIRPNQIFAVSLPYSALRPDQMRAVVDTCARELLTSYGLRTLASADAAYIGHYTGNSWERDSAYHQGTVWSWLLGPFARAHHRVYGDATLAQSFLTPVAQHVADACVGSVSEVFDGDAPHNARGCFAQAWGVAEILRSWIYLDRKLSSKP
jgi:glycogen debranching enzyme